MKIAFHLGVHTTDGDRMVRTLVNNRASLAKSRTEIVPQNRHQGIFEEALKALQGGKATPDMEQIMLDSVLEQDDTERMVCSSPAFLGAASRALGPEGLYPSAGTRIRALNSLFPSAETEYFIALKNPATLVGDLLSRASPRDLEALTEDAGPARLSWLATVQNIAQAAQGRRLVLWCHEDVPLIWPDVARLVGGIAPEGELSGGLLYMHELLGDQGLGHLRKALATQDQMTVTARRKIYAEQLAQHALPGMADQPIEVPGWSQETVDAVTQRYHWEINQIAVLPEVEFVLP